MDKRISLRTPCVGCAFEAVANLLVVSDLHLGSEQERKPHAILRSTGRY